MSAPVAPTLFEAQEAAQLLIDEGVSRVLLFGSLSRGVADDDSDIDLVALYDDLGDYSTRSLLEAYLSHLCAKDYWSRSRYPGHRFTRMGAACCRCFRLI